MEAALRKNRKLPPWYLDEPPMGPLDLFYLNAFWNLSSARRYEGGPIPWDVIVVYGWHAGLQGDIINEFVAIIRNMDAGYIAWQIKERKIE